VVWLAPAVVWLAPLLTWAPASAAPLLEVEAARGAIEVGDPLVVELTLETAATVAVELPGPQAPLGDLELVAAEAAVADTLASGRVSHRRRLTVTAFETGTARLPPLAARLVDTAGVESTAWSETLLVEVESVLAAAGADSTAELRALKPPVELPVPPDWRLIAGGVLVAALAALVIWWWRERRRAAPARRLEPLDLRAPDEWALDELARLRHQDLPAAGAVKEHYSRLTDILKPYLERRFLIHAADRTSGEVLAVLAGVGDPRYGEAQAGELARLLGESDLVKFARHRPAAGAALAAVDGAAAFVKATARHQLVAAGQEAEG
jgi:hypothetical protein